MAAAFFPRALQIVAHDAMDVIYWLDAMLTGLGLRKCLFIRCNSKVIVIVAVTLRGLVCTIAWFTYQQLSNEFVC